MQFSLRGDGFFDCDTVRVDQLFGTKFTFDKAKGLSMVIAQAIMP